MGPSKYFEVIQFIHPRDTCFIGTESCNKHVISLATDGWKREVTLWGRFISFLRLTDRSWFASCLYFLEVPIAA